MSTFAETVSDCLGFKSSNSSIARVENPAQDQLNKVRQEATHLRLNEAILVDKFRTMCTAHAHNSNALKDPKIMAAARKLKGVRQQISAYEVQETQLEDAIYQDEMASIATETISVLKKHSKKKRQRNIEAEIELLDNLGLDRQETEEHVQTQLMMMGGGENESSMAEFIASIVPDLPVDASISEQQTITSAIADAAIMKPDTQPEVVVKQPSVEIPVVDVEQAKAENSPAAAIA